MRKSNKKLIPALFIIVCLFSNVLMASATGIGKVNCDCSKQLLSDMVAFSEVINDKSYNYDKQEKEKLSGSCMKFFDEWRTANYRNPSSVKIKNIWVVPVAEKLLYDELNEGYSGCLDYVETVEQSQGRILDYAVCYEYTTRTLFGGKNTNKAYCFIGEDDGYPFCTMVDDLEASDSTIAAAAVISYSGEEALVFSY